MKFRLFAGLLMAVVLSAASMPAYGQDTPQDVPATVAPPAAAASAPAPDAAVPADAAAGQDATAVAEPSGVASETPSETPAETPTATEPTEADIDRARVLAGEAGTLYENGQYAESIVKFNQALDLYRHPVIWFNLAKAYEKLAEYEKAADAYRQYLTLHLEQTGAPASDQADTERTIEILREKAYLALPEVSIDSDPRGAEVYIDGADVLNGQTPMKIHLVEGTHSLVIKADGYQTVQRDFEVRSREPARFMFSMVQEKNSGGIVVMANVRGARIHVDGKVVGATPMLQPFEVEPGRHHVMVEKDDYTDYSAVVEVGANETSEVSVSLHLAKKSFSWRGSLGITSLILGGGIVGASFWGRYYINEGYKDKGMYNVVSPNAVDAQPFETYKSMVYAGYGVGAGLAALGLGLLIWEVVRKPIEIRPEDRIDQVKPSISIVPTFGSDAVGIGAVAVF